MLGDLAREAGVAASINPIWVYKRAYIRFDSEPFHTEDLLGSPDVGETKFLYYISYKPNEHLVRGLQKPFLFNCDLIGSINSAKTSGMFRFSTLEELQEFAETNRGAAFALRWCKINQDVLDMAKSIPGFSLPLEFRMEDYTNHLKQRIFETTGKPYDGSYSLFIPGFMASIATKGADMEVQERHDERIREHVEKKRIKRAEDRKAGRPVK